MLCLVRLYVASRQPTEKGNAMTELIAKNADGHYVGTDGFVVPRNFTEFQERYPLYISSWVSKRFPEEIDALTEILTTYVRTLPDTSVYREQGLTDLIQVFNPNAGHIQGADGMRFFHFVKVCLNRQLSRLKPGVQYRERIPIPGWEM
jgi:hypothetical protein